MDIQKITEVSPHLVDLENIDDCPGPYCMSFGFDLKSLVRSIKSIGLINYPLVIESRNAMLTVITGYRRILALKSLGREKIPCRIISKSQLSPLECLLLNLHDNLATRKLNEVEKGMVLSRLTRWTPKTKILEKYMQLLGLPSHDPTLHFYIRLEEEMEKEIKEYLVQGRLSLQSAKMLLDMEQDARHQIFNLISNLKFNINQQKQLIDYLNDLIHINNKSTSQLLKEGPLQAIFSGGQLNNPQKVKAVLHFLRTKRFPSVVSAERTFRKRISRLDLPEGSRIAAPPFFEAPNYRLEVIFKDGKELKEKIEHLSAERRLEDLGDPWKDPA